MLYGLPALLGTILRSEDGAADDDDDASLVVFFLEQHDFLEVVAFDPVHFVQHLQSVPHVHAPPVLQPLQQEQSAPQPHAEAEVLVHCVQHLQSAPQVHAPPVLQPLQQEQSAPHPHDDVVVVLQQLDDLLQLDDLPHTEERRQTAW